MVLWAVALALSAVGTIVAVLVARRRRSVDHLVAALVGVAWLAAITAPAVLNTLGHESCWA